MKQRCDDEQIDYSKKIRALIKDWLKN
jgi:hypothetical protein